MTFRQFLTKYELVNKNGFRLRPIHAKISGQSIIGYKYIAPNNDAITITVEEAYFDVVRNDPDNWNDRDEKISKLVRYKPNYLVYLHTEWGYGPWPYIAVKADNEEDAIGKAAECDETSDCILLNTPERAKLVFDPKDWLRIKMPVKGPAMISRGDIIVRKVADVKKTNCYSLMHLDKIRAFEGAEEEYDDENEY